MTTHPIIAAHTTPSNVSSTGITPSPTPRTDAAKFTVYLNNTDGRREPEEVVAAQDYAILETELADANADIARLNRNLKEMAERMVAWTESPAGDLFTTRQKLETTLRVSKELETELDAANACIEGLNDTFDNARTAWDAGVARLKVDLADEADEVHKLTEMLAMERADLGRLSEENNRQAEQLGEVTRGLECQPEVKELRSENERMRKQKRPVN